MQAAEMSILIEEKERFTISCKRTMAVKLKLGSKPLNDKWREGSILSRYRPFPTFEYSLTISAGKSASV